jgi:hypothetical protein
MSLLENLIVRSLLLIGMAAIPSVVIDSKDVKAEVPSCIELSNPRLGSTCYTEVTYNARVENSKSPQVFEIPQAALPGYVIVDTRDLQESRIGTTNGPSVIITRPGTALQIRQAYQQAYQDFNDFYQRTEAEVRIRGVNFGGMSDIKQRTEEKFSSAINQLTQIQSNSEAIVIKGSAQAQWRTWVGITEYTSGGTLRGRIRVYQRYVGTPDQANRILSDAKNQILSLVGQNTNNTNNTNTTNNQPSQRLLFGAIARSDSTRKYGFAYGFDNQQAAENAALRECGTSDCKSSWFRNAFGALSVADDNAWASTWGNTREEAEQNSLQNCQRNSSQPTTCRVVLVIDSRSGVILQR